MSFVLLGVIAVVALLALLAVFMSIKTWHWAHMLLVLGVFLFGLVAMFLSAEVLRIHHALRSRLPDLEDQIATLQEQNDALQHGTSDVAAINRLFDESPFDDSVERIPGIDELNHELQISARRQGRAWFGVMPAGQFQNNQIPVAIPEGQPPLGVGAIVYLFEQGPPAVGGQQGAQYLGEFSVTASSGQTAALQPVRQLTQRTGERLVGSRGPWRIYETMPADRHAIFAELTEEQLRTLLPAASVEEYLRHGGEVTQDDDPYLIAGFDEEGRRVGPDEIEQAAEKRYDRALRAYGYLFEELARQRVLILTELEAVAADIEALKAADVHAKELTAYREQEITALKKDRELMERDRNAIAAHFETVKEMLENARGLLEDAIEANAQLAESLTRQQMERLSGFDLEQTSGGAFTAP